MAEIQVNIQRGGLGRQSTNVDTWGGLFIEVDALPASWADNAVKRIFKPEDVEEYGIKEDATNQTYKLAYWHISEAFRLAPDCTLYVQLSNIVADLDVIAAAFKNAENRLRMFGFVFSTVLIAADKITALQTAIDKLFTESMQPARAVVTYKKDAADAIPDLSSASDYRIMVDIANDFTTGGLAKAIFDGALGMCGAAGTFLGQLLSLSVHQKPSWRSFPINSGGRWLTLADINGDSVEAKTETEIKDYDTQGVNLIVRTLRLTDAFIANARMAGDTADDYGIITHGRVIDKAIVLTYDALVEFLDGPVYVDPNSGELAPETIKLFERAAYDAINNNMVIGRIGDEIEVSVDPATGSLPENAVYIDPSQNVLQTETLTVEVRITPVGAAKTIVVNIGLTVPV